MRLLYPSNPQPNYYDRDILDISTYLALPNQAPATNVYGGSITVSTNKRAVITALSLTIMRYTAAAPVAPYFLWLVKNYLTAPIYLAQVYSISNTVGAQVQIAYSTEIWLAAGDTIGFLHSDSSTGGTVDFYGFYNGFTFRA